MILISIPIILIHLFFTRRWILHVCDMKLLIAYEYATCNNTQFSVAAKPVKIHLKCSRLQLEEEFLKKYQCWTATLTKMFGPLSTQPVQLQVILPCGQVEN